MLAEISHVLVRLCSDDKHLTFTRLTCRLPFCLHYRPGITLVTLQQILMKVQAAFSMFLTLRKTFRFFFLICEHNIKQLQEEEHGPEMQHGLQVLKYLLCDFHMVTQMQADSTF